MKRAIEESKDIDAYDYIIVNDDLEECVDAVNSVIVGKKSLRENNLEFIEEIRKELNEL